MKIILERDGQRTEQSNPVIVDAFVASGWTVVEPLNDKTDKKRG